MGTRLLLQRSELYRFSVPRVLLSIPAVIVGSTLHCAILLQDATEFAKLGKTFSQPKGFVTGVKNEVREEIM